MVSLGLMPKKVPFKVVYCTGWEDDYPPKDLEVRAANSCDDEFSVRLLWLLFTTDCCPPQVHSPFVKGWRSPR